VSSLDDLVNSALDRVRASVAGQLEADLSATASDIRRLAAEASARAAAEAAERTAADLRREAEQQLADVRGDLERQRDELRASSAAELATLQRAIDEERERLADARREMEEIRQGREALERQLDELRQAVDQRTQEAGDARVELNASARALEEAHRSSEEHARTASDLQRRLEEVQQALEQTQRDRDVSRETSDALRRDLTIARDLIAQVDRLIQALRVLDHASTLGEVLDGLARLASQTSERTAVFLVSGERLRGWRAVGFDETDLVAGADLSFTEAGALGEAARSGEARTARNGGGPALPVFADGRGTRHAVALPIEVGGSVIAVLYADAADAETAEEPRWPDHVELMARHAGRVLEALTVRQAATMSAGRVPMARAAVRGGRA
jgi:hypothetical protein